MNNLNKIPRPRHNQAILVEKRPSPWIVQRYGTPFPAIRDNIDKARRRIHQLPSINSIDHFLASTAREETLTRTDDRDFERSQRSVGLSTSAVLRSDPLHGVEIVLADFFGGALERLEAGHENVGQFEKASRAGVVLVVFPQDLLGDHFTEKRPGQVDCLVMSGV